MEEVGGDQEEEEGGDCGEAGLGDEEEGEERVETGS